MARKRTRKFRRAPSFSRRRIRHREFARIYAQYRSSTGRTKRASYSFDISRIRTNHGKYLALQTIVSMMIHQKLIPEHKAGQVFPSLQDLLNARWIRVRKILKYEAGVVYVR